MIGVKITERNQEQAETPLTTRIEQLLMEADHHPRRAGIVRVPADRDADRWVHGFGMQEKIVHAVALGLVLVNIVLLMTPAALHRLSFAGEDSERFLRIRSAFVIAGPIFLAAGIAGDIFVVFSKVLKSDLAGSITSIASFLTAVGVWYLLPLLIRRRRNP